MKKFTDVFDKNYLMKALTAFLTAIFALCMIFYISYHIADRFETDLTLLNAAEKTVVRDIRADAYLFRDETVLYTSGRYDGGVAAVIPDGRRISVSERVADVYDHTSPDVKKRIAEIDRQILLLEQSRMENVSVQNTAALDSDIFKNIEAICKNSRSGLYGEALAYRAELLVSIKKKEILTGEVKDIEEQIRLLQSEKSALTAELGTRLESVYSPIAGYYYANVDGFEGILNPKALEGLTYDGFYELVGREPEGIPASAAGKIAVDFRWYIACPMSKSDSAYFEENIYYTVRFPYTNTALNMRLHSVIGEPGGSEAVAVFECTTLPDDFDYTRMQPVLICATDYTGFEIPVSAIRMVDGMEGVYVLDEVTVEFRRVNIIYEYDGYYLCVGDTADPKEKPRDEPEEEGPEGEEEKNYPWIKRNDIIITEGKNLHIGKVVG